MGLKGFQFKPPIERVQPFGWKKHAKCFASGKTSVGLGLESFHIWRNNCTAEINPGWIFITKSTEQCPLRSRVLSVPLSHLNWYSPFFTYKKLCWASKILDKAVLLGDFANINSVCYQSPSALCVKFYPKDGLRLLSSQRFFFWSMLRLMFGTGKKRFKNDTGTGRCLKNKWELII